MKRLLLVGGGHVHTIVLRALAAAPPPDVEVVLITPSDRMVYTGMLPGWIAGHYTLSDITVMLGPLVRAAGATWVSRRIVGLDLDTRAALTNQGERIAFDVVSIATGPGVAFDAVPGSRQVALPIRPLEHFVEGWQRILRYAASAEGPLRLTVIGAGAGGVELALAMQYRLHEIRDDAHVQLVTGNGPILPGHGPTARRMLHAALLRYGIRMIEGTVEHLDIDAAVLEGGIALHADAALLVTGPAADAWPRASGLATDDDGFITVDSTLRSTSHPFVFAAGDVATQVDTFRAKSGVYAVRAAPALAGNLIAALSDRPLRPHRPPAHALYLISTGAQRAVASWGPLAIGGKWVWHWKDRIDRAYIAQLRPVTSTSESTTPESSP